MSYHEMKSRSIIKSISYRVVSIIVDTCVLYFFTRKIEFTLGVVLFANAYSTIVYYVHERVWNKFHFGKKILK